MICGTCKANVATAKFCSNCGAGLGVSADVRPAAEVTITWLGEIYGRAGYKVDDLTDTEATRTFRASHPSNPNVIIDLRPTLRAMTLTSYWNIRSPTMFERGDFFQMLNLLNNKTIYCQCSVSESDLSSLGIQLGFFITDQVSELDVIAFNDFAITVTRRALSEARLHKYDAS